MSKSSSFGGTLKASGMTRVDDRHYLVVNDTKSVSEGPRIGLIDVRENSSPSYVEVSTNWDEWGGPSNDLSSICAVPGRPDEYITTESGYARNLRGPGEGDRFGRVFHFRLDRNVQGQPVASIIHVFKLPRLYDRIDGLAIGLTAHDQLILMLSERGSNGRSARLSWGTLRIGDEGIGFRIVGDLEFEAPFPGDNSHVLQCADLHLDAHNRLWVTSTISSGARGPFKSIIFRLGDFDPRRHRPKLSIDPLKPTWVVEGFRVLAIAESPEDPDSLCFISDDKELGGVWRPMVKPRSR